LSRKQVGQADEEEADKAADGAEPGAAAGKTRELRGGTGSGTGQLFSLSGAAEGEEPKPETTETPAPPATAGAPTAE
jgi:hypothetical protein